MYKGLNGGSGPTYTPASTHDGRKYRAGSKKNTASMTSVDVIREAIWVELPQSALILDLACAKLSRGPPPIDGKNITLSQRHMQVSCLRLQV